MKSLMTLDKSPPEPSVSDTTEVTSTPSAPSDPAKPAQDAADGTNSPGEVPVEREKSPPSPSRTMPPKPAASARVSSSSGRAPGVNPGPVDSSKPPSAPQPSLPISMKEHCRLASSTFRVSRQEGALSLMITTVSAIWEQDWQSTWRSNQLPCGLACWRAHRLILRCRKRP